jgi:hypothetical protein
MKRNEEVERLAKQKEIWNKEQSLTKEEEVLSWTNTIESLEKIYKHFYSYKDYRLGKFKPKPVWLCEGEYKNEDKEKSKKEVIGILKLCKKEHILINSPAIVNLIYANRLNKREAIVSAQEQKEESVHTVQAVVNETDLKNKKRNDGYVTNNIAINVVASEQNILENDQYRVRIKEAYSRKKRK